MRLPEAWELLFQQKINLDAFYKELDYFINKFEPVIPQKEKIFAVFGHVHPQDVKVILYGEDPYPRQNSACGVAFWDLEINEWSDKTNGNSLKNILKALLTHSGKATYNSSIEECRREVLNNGFPAPPELFRLWLNQGILLVNTALTFSNVKDKKEHMDFWHNFQCKLIEILNETRRPFYILWGKKAQKWEHEITKTLPEKSKIIKQGHPTFIHQFMDRNNIYFSPFDDIIQKTKLKWF